MFFFGIPCHSLRNVFYKTQKSDYWTTAFASLKVCLHEEVTANVSIASPKYPLTNRTKRESIGLETKATQRTNTNEIERKHQ